MEGTGKGEKAERSEERRKSRTETFCLILFGEKLDSRVAYSPQVI